MLEVLSGYDDDDATFFAVGCWLKPFPKTENVFVQFQKQTDFCFPLGLIFPVAFIQRTVLHKNKLEWSFSSSSDTTFLSVYLFYKSVWQNAVSGKNIQFCFCKSI